jgi:hypothetical protein
MPNWSTTASTGCSNRRRPDETRPSSGQCESDVLHQHSCWRELVRYPRQPRCSCPCDQSRSGAGSPTRYRSATAVARQPEALMAFREQLAALGAYVFTINAFPFGPFHGVRVKEQDTSRIGVARSVSHSQPTAPLSLPTSFRMALKAPPYREHSKPMAEKMARSRR